MKINAEKIYSFLFIAFFIAILATPTIDNCFNFTNKIQLLENRVYAKKPETSLLFKNPADYLTKFNSFYNDHFGMRKLLIKITGSIKYNIFNTSPVKNSTIGKDGWFFLSHRLNCNDFFTKIPQTDLEGWNSYLQSTGDWAKKNGVLYIFTVAPDKKTIYPEYLPRDMQKKNAEGWYGQFVEYINSQSNFKIIDLRPELISAKKSLKVYYKTDEHWNPQGSFIASQKIAGIIQKKYPSLKPLNINDFKIAESEKLGDLTRYMALSSKITETVINLGQKNSWEKTNEKSGEGGITTFYMNDKNKPNILVIGDSFSSLFAYNLIPMANKIIYYLRCQNNIDKDIIKKENIKIVVQEVAEMYLKIKDYREPLNFTK